MRTKKSESWFDTLKTVVIAVLIALVVRTFAYEPFNIPSGSMVPTLLEGDYLFVSKFSYGYSRHTVAFGAPLFDGRILGGEPERGDVAVFMLPSDPSIDYIKRVIGLPGDRIQMIGGILHINGEAVERELVSTYETTNGFGQREFGEIYIETLPNGRQHYIREVSDSAAGDDTDVYTVPEGHYFMMGDNRDRSQDSRAIANIAGRPTDSIPDVNLIRNDAGQVVQFRPVGFIPVENLVGRAEFLWFSLEDGSFWQFWRWPTELRWERMFQGIE